MTAMLERAARAAYENWLKRPSTIDEARRGGPFPDWPRCDTDYWYSQARAVLLAVREPDRKWAADVCEELCEPELTFNPAPTSAFTAMIYGILEGR